MLEHIRQTIQKFQLITAGQTLVVGVSGGTDSLALLHVLHQLAPRLNITIHAATLDHQLRGAESAEDVRFVEQTCNAWGINITIGQADVAQIAREKQLGVEAAARLARYNFLAQTAHNVGATCIAVAHHMDDQAETVLMHLLRGTGTHGLAGMALLAPVPGRVDLSLIRPLLHVSRAEIEAYCEQHHLMPRHDSTNSDTSLLRNAIRLVALPSLSQYAPHIKPALSRLAEIAAVEDDYLQLQVRQFTNSEVVKISNRHVAIGRDGFGELHPALQRRVLIWAVGRLGSVEDTTAQLIVEASEIALRGKQGAIALLGGGFRLRVDYDVLVVESEKSEVVDLAIPFLPTNFSLNLDVPSHNQLIGWVLKVTFEQSAKPPFCRLFVTNGSQVVLRTRRDGDIFSPLGMKGHTQKLSKWMVNRKIPKTLRDQTPLLVINDTIAAIAVSGEWFVSEVFAVRNNEQPIIYFQFLENS